MKDLKHLIEQTKADAIAFIVRDADQQVESCTKLVEYSDSIDDMLVTFCYEVTYDEFYNEIGDSLDPLIEEGFECSSVDLKDVILCIGDQEYSILNIVSKW